MHFVARQRFAAARMLIYRASAMMSFTPHFVRQGFMELENQTGQTAAWPDYSNGNENQQIINDILRLSLEPCLFQELLERILHYLVTSEHLHLAPRGAVFLFDAESRLLNLKAGYGLSDKQISRCGTVKLGTCHCGRAAKHDKIHFFTSLPPLSEDQQLTIETGHYCVPIVRNDQTIGILTLYVNPEHELSFEMEQLLESLANILAAVVESHRMDQQLIELVKDLRVSVVSLREEKLFSESIIQNLHHGLIVADRNCIILKSNRVARQILQPVGSSIDGKSLKTLVGSSHAGRLTCITENNGETVEKEITLSTGEGENKIISYTTGPRLDTHGNQVGVIISLTDVTELRYVHREMEKMNRLSTVAEIASAVAHEVRNPLAGIKIMAQSIEEDAYGNDQQLECSRRIIRQVNRLNELLTEFFSYARPVVPNKRPTTLADIIAETKPLIVNRLLQNRIEMAEDTAPDLPEIIADPNQMQQVFLNLMLNSIDAIRQDGNISIKARFLQGNAISHIRKKLPGLLTGSRYVLVKFSDNGSGMPTEVAEKVFEPFFTTKSNGTGLGLSIVYRTLLENDGVITLESEPGKGTTFNIFLPAVK